MSRRSPVKYSFAPNNSSSSTSSSASRPRMQTKQVFKIISVVALPLIAVALLAAAGVSVSIDRRSKAIAVAESLRSAEFVRALLTTLQRERGMTCIHLEMIRAECEYGVKYRHTCWHSMMFHKLTPCGSEWLMKCVPTDCKVLREGGSSFFEQLNDYRDQTDQIVARWISDGSDDINPKERKTSAIKDLYSYRKKAHSGNFSCNESLKWYNNLNKRLLQSIISQDVDESQTGFNGLSAYHNILLAKDLIGVTRALGGTFFTQERMETDAAVQFSEAGGGAAVLLQLMAYQMPAAAEFYSGLKEKHVELVNQIDNTRNMILFSGLNYAHERIIDEQSANLWWNQMTQYIDLVISPTEQFITERLLRELEIEKVTANQRLLLTLLVALIALILCPAMTVIYLMHAQRLQRANRTFDQELLVRMEQINSQKQKSEQLLTSYMPKKLPNSVVNTLTWTMQLEARVYASVTVCACDILGFGQMFELGTPEQIVRLLNVLHNRLDKIASRHDCFKFDRGVDSSATFVSGLPVVNSSHSYVIARLALDLMHLAESFSIPFLINQTIALRVGIHTGPVCTGVMGNKIPLYTILGKTVQIANLMERTAEGMLIHISSATFEHLTKRHPGEFEYERSEIVCFNEIEIGKISTYNLLRNNRHIDARNAAYTEKHSQYWQRDYDKTQTAKTQRMSLEKVRKISL